MRRPPCLGRSQEGVKSTEEWQEEGKKWKREGIPALEDYFIYHGTKLKKPCEQEGICRVLRS